MNVTTNVNEKLAKNAFFQLGNVLILGNYKHLWEIIKTYHFDKNFVDLVDEYLKNLDNFAEYRKKLNEINKKYPKNDLNRLVCNLFLTANPADLRDFIDYGIWGVNYKYNYQREFYLRYKYEKDGTYF